MDNPLRPLFKQVLGQKQDTQKFTPAVLGNGFGVVAVPGLTNYVFVRIGAAVDQVYNNIAPLINELPVWVGVTLMQPDFKQVLSVRSGLQFTGQNAAPISGIPLHAETHRFLGSGVRGGTDPVYIELRQLLPLRVSGIGGLKINVYPGILYINGQYRVISTATPIDLNAYVPLLSAGQLVKYVLIYADSTGAVAVADGTAKAVADLTNADIPATPTGGTDLAAIRLYTRQTDIYEARTNTDVIDLRFGRPGGSGGGSLTVRETDGAPSVTATTLVFPNDTLTDEGGGVVSYIPPNATIRHIQDLTSQIPATGDHYILSYSVYSSMLTVYKNGLRQEPTAITIDSNGLGFTTAFTCVAGDVLVADYNGTDAAPNELTATFTYGGALSTTAGDVRLYNPTTRGRTITKVFAAVNTASTSGAVTVDIHKNGTTIFTTQANRPSIVQAAYTGESVTMDVTTWAAGEYLQMCIDDTGAGAQNLTVHIVYS